MKIPSDKLEVMQKIVNSNVSEIIKENIIKKLSGTRCAICGGIPIHEVSYKIEDATILEHYCDSCVKTVYERS